MATAATDVGRSQAEELAALDKDERREVLGVLSEEEAEALEHDWRFWARPKQLAPGGDWGTWVLRAGRGFGKTRAGAGWVHERAEAEPGRWMALVAKTPADARDYMVEGPGGLLKHAPIWCRNAEGSPWPNYEPSKRRVTWPNGSWATIYSSEEPDQLRGFSGDTAWLDEFAKWSNPRECWDNLMYGMREASADRPRVCITTTPRPVEVLKDIERKESSRVVVGSSYENRSNLDPSWFEETLADYEGTTLGRQEIHAEIIQAYEGALVSERLWIRRTDRDPDDLLSSLSRVAVGVDPAGWSSRESDETGIVVAGIEGGNEPHLYVLDDRSGRRTAKGWAEEAVAAYKRWRADAIVGETNYGGEMVIENIRSVDGSANVVRTDASRGKRVRAEPLGSRYEQRRVLHVREFQKLEDQLCTWDPSDRSADSPDRVDALVWAFKWLTETPKKVRWR